MKRCCSSSTRRRVGHTQPYRLVGTLSESSSGDYCPATSSLLIKVRMHPRHLRFADKRIADLEAQLLEKRTI
jgi:hypothetical protein